MADHSVAGGGILNAGNRTYETEYELAQDFEGDGAIGKNTAYGNQAGTSGGHLTARAQGEKHRK
jgi:hypothetical protein